MNNEPKFPNISNINISVVILMAGSSIRFNEQQKIKQNKILYQFSNIPVFFYSLNTFVKTNKITNYFLVVKEEEQEDIKELVLQNFKDLPVEFIIGGNTRAESVKNAIVKIKNTNNSDIVLIHDAARPLVEEHDINALIKDFISGNYQAGSLYHEVTDTVRQIDQQNKTNFVTLNRDSLMFMSTPQIFRKDTFDVIINNQNKQITDELSLFSKLLFHKESSVNVKITNSNDVNYVNYLLSLNNEYKVGHSFDYHNFKESGPLILGGVSIDVPYGLEGHSDADCIYHSVCEALLGALGLGDIGYHFSDNKEENKNRNSADFVKYAIQKLEESNYCVNNIDIMIYLEKPNLKTYKSLIANNIKQLINCDFVNVKATTMEKQGLVGNQKGIGTETVVLIKKSKQ